VIRLFKWWGLDNLLYMVDDEEGMLLRLEEIEEEPENIYFLATIDTTGVDA
jgi:hypothetical protein